jgi:hypothetical protein
LKNGALVAPFFFVVPLFSFRDAASANTVVHRLAFPAPPAANFH